MTYFLAKAVSLHRLVYKGLSIAIVLGPVRYVQSITSFNYKKSDNSFGANMALAVMSCASFVAVMRTVPAISSVLPLRKEVTGFFDYKTFLNVPL